MEYVLVDGRWEIKVAKNQYTVEAFIEHVMDWFVSQHGIERTPETYKRVFYFNWKNVYTDATVITFGKNKSGKLIETPDMIRSGMNILMDYVQSSAFVMTENKAKETLDPRNAKDAKEIDKLAQRAIVELSVHIWGKERWGM